MCQSVDLWSARAWIMGDPGTFNGGRHSGAGRRHSGTSV